MFGIREPQSEQTTCWASCTAREAYYFRAGIIIKFTLSVPALINILITRMNLVNGRLSVERTRTMCSVLRLKISLR